MARPTTTAVRIDHISRDGKKFRKLADGYPCKRAGVFHAAKKRASKAARSPLAFHRKVNHIRFSVALTALSAPPPPDATPSAVLIYSHKSN